MAVTIHTPDELRGLLVEVIKGAAGGDADRWREAVGHVHKLPIATNTHELAGETGR